MTTRNMGFQQTNVNQLRGSLTLGHRKSRLPNKWEDSWTSDPFIVFREKLQEGSRSSKNGFYVTDCQLAFSKQHILKNLCWLNGTPAIHHSENIPSKLCSMHGFVSLKYWVDMKLNIFPTFGYCATWSLKVFSSKIHRIWILPKTFFEYRDPPFQTDPQKKKTAPKPRSPKENLPSVALVLLIVDDDLQHIIIQDIPIIANRLAYDSRLAKRLGAFILPFFPVNLYING